MNGLNHNALTCSAVPIPPWERPLQTVEAQPYFNVSQASLVLEGIVFDRNNNLLFVDVATGRVFKLTMKRKTRITKTIIWDRYKQVDALHDIARMFDRYHSSILPTFRQTCG